MSTRDLLSTLSDRLGIEVSRQMLRRGIEAGIATPERVGGWYKFRESDVDPLAEFITRTSRKLAFGQSS